MTTAGPATNAATLLHRLRKATKASVVITCLQQASHYTRVALPAGTTKDPVLPNLLREVGVVMRKWSADTTMVLHGIAALCGLSLCGGAVLEAGGAIQTAAEFATKFVSYPDIVGRCLCVVGHAPAPDRSLLLLVTKMLSMYPFYVPVVRAAAVALDAHVAAGTLEDIMFAVLQLARAGAQHATNNRVVDVVLPALHMLFMQRFAQDAPTRLEMATALVGAGGMALMQASIAGTLLGGPGLAQDPILFACRRRVCNAVVTLLTACSDSALDDAWPVDMVETLTGILGWSSRSIELSCMTLTLIGWVASALQRRKLPVVKRYAALVTVARTMLRDSGAIEAQQEGAYALFVLLRPPGGKSTLFRALSLQTVPLIVRAVATCLWVHTDDQVLANACSVLMRLNMKEVAGASLLQLAHVVLTAARRNMLCENLQATALQALCTISAFYPGAFTFAMEEWVLEAMLMHMQTAPDLLQSGLVLMARAPARFSVLPLREQVVSVVVASMVFHNTSSEIVRDGKAALHALLKGNVVAYAAAAAAVYAYARRLQTSGAAGALAERL